MKLGRRLRGRQRRDAAGGQAGVDRVQASLAGSVPLVGSCGSTWLVAMISLTSKWIRATLRISVPVGRPGLGLDDVGDVAHAAAGAVLGRQEAGEHVGRQAGARVDRLEAGESPAGVGVQPQLDLDVEVCPL